MGNEQLSFSPGEPQKKALSLLGLARKAGKLEMGADPAAEALQKGKAFLILLAGDLSRRSARKAADAASQKNIPVLQAPWGMDEAADALGKRAGILAVCDRGFAEKLTALLSRQASSTEEESYTYAD